MSWGLVAVGVGSVASGVLGADANRKAGNQANDATMASLEEQRRQFDLLRADQAPYREAGVSALEQLRNVMGFDPTPDAASVMSEPGYQFGLDQGRDAIQGTAAARGGLYSGQALKELTKFGGDYATGRYGDAWNRAQTGFGNRWGRLASLAGIGQTATQQTGQAGQNYANQVGALRTGNANAQGAAAIGNANIWGSGINQLAGFAANRFGQPGAAGGGVSPNIWAPDYESLGGWTGQH